MMPYDEHDLVRLRGQELRRGAAARRSATARHRPAARRSTGPGAVAAWRAALGRRLIRWGQRLAGPAPAAALRAHRR